MFEKMAGQYFFEKDNIPLETQYCRRVFWPFVDAVVAKKMRAFFKVKKEGLVKNSLFFESKNDR